MDSAKALKKKLVLPLIVAIIFILLFSVKMPNAYKSIPKPHWPPNVCSLRVSEQTITPLKNTKHLLVSAYMDQRVKDLDIRIIGIFRRDSIQPLHCFFCCSYFLSKTTPATILQHSDHFGFPFATTDVMCQIPQNCSATHVTLLTTPEKASDYTWLPIRNRKTNRQKEENMEFDFTVCISNLFGGYNNVLQFAETLEMYRLLGVNRVVIYNTSCGPELGRLLQNYSQDGFVEMVPWPIDKHLNPSRGWLHSQHGGDVHYFGQLTTLNECIYRSMEHSRYVLLNDIDEILMPYKHNNLTSLMNTLEKENPNTGVFLIENHTYPKKPFNQSKWGPLHPWNGVPGFDIMVHIYREEPNRNIYHPHKLIVQPRTVQQTSVHDVLVMSGTKFKVPPDVCRIIHSPISTPTDPPLDQLHVDTRLWDFKDKLLPNVIKVLRRAELLKSERQN